MRTILFASLFLAVASPLAAQDTLAPRIVGFTGGYGNRDTTEAMLGLNALDCDRRAEVKIVLGFGTTLTTPPGFDFWRGDGVDCSPTSARSGSNTTSCTFLAHMSGGVANNQLEVPFSELLTGDTTLCSIGEGAGAPQSTRIYVFLTNVTAYKGDASIPYGYFELKVDSKWPSAVPLDRTSLSGNTGVRITWTPNASETLPISYYAYIRAVSECGAATSDDGGTSDAGTDAGTDADVDAAVTDGSVGDGGTSDGSDGGVVVAAPPVPGERPASVESYRLVGQGISRFTLDPSQYTALGGYVELAIVPVDQAGNVGVASSYACVHRIDTSGYCDANPGACDGGCSVRPGSTNRDPASPSALWFAAALLVLRRFRRAS